MCIRDSPYIHHACHSHRKDRHHLRRRLGWFSGRGLCRAAPRSTPSHLRRPLARARAVPALFGRGRAPGLLFYVWSSRQQTLAWSHAPFGALLIGTAGPDDVLTLAVPHPRKIGWSDWTSEAREVLRQIEPCPCAGDGSEHCRPCCGPGLCNKQ